MKAQRRRVALLKDDVGQAGDFGSAHNVYLRLWKVLPAADGTGGTELDGTGGYAAVECSGSFPTVGASDSEVSNDTAISFATATADYEGDVVGYTLGDHATNTSEFNRIVEMSTLTVLNGDTVTFAIGSIKFEEES